MKFVLCQSYPLFGRACWGRLSQVVYRLFVPCFADVCADSKHPKGQIGVQYLQGGLGMGATFQRTSIPINLLKSPAHVVLKFLPLRSVANEFKVLLENSESALTEYGKN